MNNNLQLKLNKVYKDKLDSNDKLIKSSKFVRIITREIKFKNGGISKVRLFSNGDFDKNIDISLKEINNIFNLCKVNPFVKFWLVTRQFETLFSYISKHKIPGNLNIMFSTPIKPNQFFIDFCNKYKIQMSQIVLSKNKSNCDSSKNGASCLKSKCDSCFTFSNKIKSFYVHGKNNKQKLRELIKIESRR